MDCGIDLVPQSFSFTLKQFIIHTVPTFPYYLICLYVLHMHRVLAKGGIMHLRIAKYPGIRKMDLNIHLLEHSNGLCGITILSHAGNLGR